MSDFISFTSRILVIQGSQQGTFHLPLINLPLYFQEPSINTLLLLLIWNTQKKTSLGINNYHKSLRTAMTHNSSIVGADSEESRTIWLWLVIEVVLLWCIIQYITDG